MSRPKITDTPQFRAAVQEAAAEQARAAVAEALAAAMARGSVIPGSEGSVAEGDPARTAGLDTQSLIQGLAMAIAEVSDQGSGRKRVSPEILGQRAKAKERMDGLIQAEVIRCGGNPSQDDHVPYYGLTAAVVLADQIIQPAFRGRDHTVEQTKIRWLGVPNGAMVGLNAKANEILKAFRDSIGSVEKPVADKALSITHNGLVIQGAALTGSGRSPIAVLREGQTPSSSGGLSIDKGRHQNKVVEIAVLGTTAPRAVEAA